MVEQKSCVDANPSVDSKSTHAAPSNANNLKAVLAGELAAFFRNRGISCTPNSAAGGATATKQQGVKGEEAAVKELTNFDEVLLKLPKKKIVPKANVVVGPLQSPEEVRATYKLSSDFEVEMRKRKVDGNEREDHSVKKNRVEETATSPVAGHEAAEPDVPTDDGSSDETGPEQLSGDENGSEGSGEVISSDSGNDTRDEEYNGGEETDNEDANDSNNNGGGDAEGQKGGDVKEEVADSLEAYRAIADFKPRKWVEQPDEVIDIPTNMRPVTKYKRRFGQARLAMGMGTDQEYAVPYLANLSLKVAVDNFRSIVFDGMPQVVAELIVEEAVERTDFFDKPSMALESFFKELVRDYPTIVPPYLAITNIFVLNEFLESFVAMFPAVIEMEVRDVDIKGHEIWTPIGHYATKLESLQLINCVYGDDDLRKLAIAIEEAQKKDPGAFKSLKRLILTGRDCGIQRVSRLVGLFPNLEQIVFQAPERKAIGTDGKAHDACGAAWLAVDARLGGWSSFVRNVSIGMIAPAVDCFLGHLSPCTSGAEKRSWASPLYEVLASKWVFKREPVTSFTEPQGYDPCLYTASLHVAVKSLQTLTAPEEILLTPKVSK